MSKKIITPEKKQQLNTLMNKHNVAIAYLFGSQAHGTAGQESDTDIAVLFTDDADKNSDYLEKNSALYNELRKIFKKEVDLVDLSETHSPLLRHRAIFRGQLLHCEDSKLRFQFEQRVLQEYEDTRYLRAMQSRIMRQQILAGKEKT